MRGAQVDVGQLAHRPIVGRVVREEREVPILGCEHDENVEAARVLQLERAGRLNDALRLLDVRHPRQLHENLVAVGTLLRWYRAGIDPMARLLDLSTFLGHVSPSSTAVYLTITTELLESAIERFAHFAVNSRKECLR